MLANHLFMSFNMGTYMSTCTIQSKQMINKHLIITNFQILFISFHIYKIQSEQLIHNMEWKQKMKNFP
jgi:hypothetical protein